MYYEILDTNEQTLLKSATPTWVRLNKDGTFGLTSLNLAHGVDINGTVWSIAGRPSIPGAQECYVGILPSGDEPASNDELQASIVELSQLDAEQVVRNQELDDAITELSMLIGATMKGDK